MTKRGVGGILVTVSDSCSFEVTSDKYEWFIYCTDDVLDEYINKAAKLAGLPSEPDIPEEGETMEQPVNTSMDS